MKVKTTQFGEIEVEEKDLVVFPKGLPGFEEEHQFVLLPYAKESPFVLLQSATEDYLAFLMTNPFLFFADYAFSIDQEAMDEMAIRTQADFAVYVMITVPGGSVQDMTANLAAPVVVNIASRQGKQLVMEKNDYHTKHRLFKAAPQDKEAR